MDRVVRLDEAKKQTQIVHDELDECDVDAPTVLLQELRKITERLQNVRDAVDELEEAA